MAVPRTLALWNIASRNLRTILAKHRKSIRVLTVYVWNNKHDPAFWEQIGEQIRGVLASHLKRIIMDGLIPPLCVYLNYTKTIVLCIIIVGVSIYSIRCVLRPMLIIIHDELGKIADFIDKVAYWLAQGYFVPYIGVMLVSGMGLQVLTICFKNPPIFNLIHETLAQMSSGPQIALRLLQSTALGDGLLKLLQSIQATAWGDGLLVCYQHTWYQKSAAILAIGLRLPALQTLRSVPEATLQLLPSIPPRALAEGLVSFLWIERPWYQKPAMLAIGLQITSLTIRRLMRLCILTHNKLYYPYAWLADQSRFVVTAVVL